MRRSTLKVLVLWQSPHCDGLVGTWLGTDCGVVSGTGAWECGGVKKVFSDGESEGTPEHHSQALPITTL